MNNEENLSLIISEQIHIEVANELVPHLREKELNEEWQKLKNFMKSIWKINDFVV